MNPDDEKFEALLRQVKPAAPSAEFLERLRATRPAVPAKPARPNIIRFIIPLAAAAALVIGLTLYFSDNTSAPTMAASAVAQSATVRPVQQTDCVLGAREVGIFRAPDGRPYRVVQSVGIGSETWEDTATGERKTRTFAQQQVLLVSMNSI
jgi:hypothetical protein